MAGNLYDTTTLLQTLNIVRQPAPAFWLNFFPTTLTFDTEDIAFDKVYTDRRKLAPFVVPNIQGRVMSTTGYESKYFRPAYVKPKHVINPSMVLPRRAGEALGTGSLSLQQRKDAVVASLLLDHDSLHQNRQEWLAAKAIIDGKVTIAGEDYPSTLVDFRRNAALTITLSGSARWDQSGAAPMTDLKAARLVANPLSGARITTHIFGGDAWDAFTTKVDLKEQMNRNYGGLETKVTRLVDGYEGMEFMGTIQGLDGAGRIDAYVNTSKYIDPETGAEDFYLNQKTVVGVSEAVGGVRCFGAIKDFDAELKAMEVFYKTYKVEDPSAEYLLSQSAPLWSPGTRTPPSRSA
jgi:hypothetical protein